MINSSGALYLSGGAYGNSVAYELFGTEVGLDMNNSVARQLAQVPTTGQYSMSNFYGKSAIVPFSAGGNDNSTGWGVQLDFNSSNGMWAIVSNGATLSTGKWCNVTGIQYQYRIYSISIISDDVTHGPNYYTTAGSWTRLPTNTNSQICFVQTGGQSQYVQITYTIQVAVSNSNANPVTITVGLDSYYDTGSGGG